MKEMLIHSIYENIILLQFILHGWCIIEVQLLPFSNLFADIKLNVELAT